MGQFAKTNINENHTVQYHWNINTTSNNREQARRTQYQSVAAVPCNPVTMQCTRYKHIHKQSCSLVQ